MTKYSTKGLEMKKTVIQLLFAVLLTTGLAGCISFSPPKREKRPSFMVVAKRHAPEASHRGAMDSTLVSVRRFRTAEPYDSHRIVILNTISSQIDFLSEGDLAVSPGTTASNALRRWLADSKAFAGVVDSAASSTANSITLEGWVEQAGVEIDEDGKASFKLALTIWFQASDSTPLMKRANFMHATSVPLDSVEPSVIASAFGDALEIIFTQFEPWLIQSFEKKR